MATKSSGGHDDWFEGNKNKNICGQKDGSKEQKQKRLRPGGRVTRTKSKAPAAKRMWYMFSQAQ
jgi:hypothetical protein